jgi:hypothetical protein
LTILVGRVVGGGRPVVVDVSWMREIYPAVPSPATVDWRLAEEIYPGAEDPRVFTVEMRFD